MEIANTIVLITGGSSGIGAAMARAMSRAGAAQVLLLARSERGLKKVAAEIAADGGQARIYKVDLADRTAVEDVARRILGEVGVPDILINNAGSGRWKFLAETGIEEIAQIMTLPYLAAAWMTRLFLPGMLTRGCGHIVNISSVASRQAWPGATAYIAVCRAMRGLSDALRADLHRTGIAVTHYESGPIDSPYWQNNPGSRERVPGIARILVPALTEEEVARAVIAGVRNNRRIIVVPTMMKTVYLLHAFVPWLVQWLMTVTGYRPAPP
jgi:short-subunit dehydrogenase